MTLTFKNISQLMGSIQIKMFLKCRWRSGLCISEIMPCYINNDRIHNRNKIALQLPDTII